MDAAAAVTKARDHRERQIAEVLIRYGLSYLAGVVGLERLVAVARRLTGREPPQSHTEPENLRLALEELGPTFIKLGQVLGGPALTGLPGRAEQAAGCCAGGSE